jgi:hypothetical protein
MICVWSELYIVYTCDGPIMSIPPLPREGLIRQRASNKERLVLLHWQKVFQEKKKPCVFIDHRNSWWIVFAVDMLLISPKMSSYFLHLFDVWIVLGQERFINICLICKHLKRSYKSWDGPNMTQPNNWDFTTNANLARSQVARHRDWNQLLVTSNHRPRAQDFYHTKQAQGSQHIHI